LGFLLEETIRGSGRFEATLPALYPNLQSVLMETDFLTKLEKIASFANPWASFLFLLVTSFPSVIMLVVSVTRLQTSMAFLLQQRSYAILIGEFILAIFLMTTGDLLGGCFDPFGHFDSPGLHRIYELQFFYKSIWTNAEIVAVAFFLTACFLQIGVVLVLDGASENRRSAIVWFLFVLFSLTKSHSSLMFSICYRISNGRTSIGPRSKFKRAI
jgi:hypothetical protein